MQRTSIEGTLIGNARASRTTTAKSLLKIYTTSVGKDIFALQKTSSINHRNSEAKSIAKSFHLSKPSIGDIKDTELQRGSVSQASPGKSIGSSGLLSGTDFIQPKHFYLDRQVRVKRKNLPSIKGGMVTEQDISLSRSINHETVSVDPYSAGSLHQSNHDFGKQGEYIRSNPHFNRFHRTLYAIDKIESEKLLLSKETFYYPEQVQMIQSVVKTRATEENDDNLNLLTRVLKENKKEEIDIPPGKICYVKIYTHGKVLPLKVDIEVKYGSFEAFVSRRSEKPGFGNNDFYFTSNQFSIDYGEFNDDVSCLYFGIASLEKSKISILCTYIIKTSLKKEESSSPKPKDKSLSPTRPKSKGVYEFVGQNINQEQLKMFEESVSKIKAERKRKNLIMAGGKNWLIENKEIASEYHRLKEVHISTSNKQWELKVQRTKDMKDIVETEKKKKMLLEKLKFELAKMETEMQEKRAKKKREKFRVEASWMAMLVLFRLVKEVNEKKRAMVAVNVLKRIKEMTATQIQKKMRKLLNKKYLVRVFGHKNDTFLESSDLEIRNQVNLFKCLNAMALLTKQQKEETAGLVVSYLAQDLVIPMKLTTGLEKYIERVIRVQKQWRTKRIIAAAKVSLFMKVWRQFCQEITDEEAELKKKKYSQTIAQIRDFHIMKHARKFVRDKMRGFLRILHGAAEKEREAKIKAKTTTSIIDIPSKIQDQASARQNAEGVTIENTQRNIEDDGPTFRMHTVFAKPTKDELRVILDKIVDEMKDGKGGIKSFLL